MSLPPDMPAPPQTAAPVRRRVWLRVLFGASLALNLLIIGLVIGAFARPGGPDRFGRPAPVSMGAVLYRELPGPDRRALWKSVRAQTAQAGGRGQIRTAQARALTDALRATPFDAGAVSQMLLDQAQDRSDWLLAVQQEWLRRVTAMTGDERADYAMRLEAALARRSARPRAPSTDR